MWKEVFASLVILSILGPTECLQISNLNTLMKGTLMQINKPSKTPGKTKPEIDIQNVAPKPDGGIPAKIFPIAPTTKDMETALKTATAKVKNDELTEQKMPNFDTSNSQTEGFGPHLLTSPEAIKISESARVMIETAKNAMKKLNIEKRQRVSVLERVSNSFLNTIQTQAGCEFTAGPCNQASQYRTPDGSCNNVANPLWGKSHTPFERFIPAFYEDGLDDPRATDVFGDPLPLARDISVEVHTVSDSTTQMKDLSHFSMEFGQFVSHDIQMNALSKGQYMSNLNCCRSPNTRNCFPIPLPSNDAFYGSFNRTCMNFVRALETTKLDCSLGERQQLNMNTHFLDGSAVYGSNKVTANSLRQLSGGRLESTNNQLLHKDIPNASSCRCKHWNIVSIRRYIHRMQVQNVAT